VRICEVCPCSCSEEIQSIDDVLTSDFIFRSRSVVGSLFERSGFGGFDVGLRRRERRIIDIDLLLE
jgi:hypothetical protein